MANKSLFASLTSRLPRANAVNEAGGLAYKLEPKHALAQVAATGTFGNAFYSTAQTQLDEVLKLIDEVDDNQYLAKLALYAREKAFMKDMPAALLVALSVRDTELMHRVFDRVVDIPRVFDNKPGADAETTMIVALTPRIIDMQELSVVTGTNNQ